MKVIAISGFKRSGKDTIANYLCEKYEFRRISFADPLKQMVSDFFNVPRGWLDDSENKESPLKQYPAPATDGFTTTVSEFMVREFRTIDGFSPNVSCIRANDGFLQSFTNGWENLYHTPRSLAILIGSSMRSAKPSFWIDRAIEEIKMADLLGTDKIVISDMRYKSEMNQLRQTFGNDLTTIRVNRFDNSTSTDPSELDLVDSTFDFVIENKDTKEELFSKLETLYSL